MARGWESKNVEEQQAEHVGQAAAATAAASEVATRERERQALKLQRERILSERTSNAGRRAALQAALTQVEAALAQLEELG